MLIKEAIKPYNILKVDSKFNSGRSKYTLFIVGLVSVTGDRTTIWLVSNSNKKILEFINYDRKYRCFAYFCFRRGNTQTDIPNESLRDSNEFITNEDVKQRYILF